jgi:hypothetical protein
VLLHRGPGLISRIEDTYLAVDTCRMASRETGTSKAAWLDEVEAPHEAAAMNKAAAEFKVLATRLMALSATTVPILL